MPTPGRIRITRNSELTNPLLDFRGVANHSIEWNGQFQITEFENDAYLEFDYVENEWYFNLYATLPGTYLNDLLDVTITNLADKNILNYNILTQQWENSGRLTEAEQDIAGINTEISNINNDIDTINQTITTNQTNTQNQITAINNTINSVNSSSGSTSGGFVPEGGIIMWSGTTVPAGWALCDGSNGTPNLVDRFIIGSTVMNGQTIFSNSANPFGPGGADSPSSSTTTSVVLNENNLPPHTHGAGTLQPKANNDTFITFPWDRAYHPSYTGGFINNAKVDPAEGYGPNWEGIFANGVLRWDLTIDGNTSDGDFANDPISFTISPKKYYALAFIMRKYGTASRDYTQPPSSSGSPNFSGSIENSTGGGAQDPGEFQQNQQL